MSNTRLPSPQYYDIQELSKRWGWTDKQLHDLACSYLIKIKILLVDTLAHNTELENYFHARGRKDYQLILDGLYFVYPDELQKIFTLGPNTSESISIRRVFDRFVDHDNLEAGGDHNPYELASPIKANMNALRVDAREVERVEREFDFDDPNIPFAGITRISSKRENNLLRTIGGLSLLLNDYPDFKWGDKDTPNIHALSEAIQELAGKYEVSDKGQGKSNMYSVIKDGIKVFTDS